MASFQNCQMVSIGSPGSKQFRRLHLCRRQEQDLPRVSSKESFSSSSLFWLFSFSVEKVMSFWWWSLHYFAALISLVMSLFDFTWFVFILPNMIWIRWSFYGWIRMGESSVPELRRSDVIRLHGLSNVQYNGRSGVVINPDVISHSQQIESLRNEEFALQLKTAIQQLLCLLFLSSVFMDLPFILFLMKDAGKLLLHFWSVLLSKKKFIRRCHIQLFGDIGEEISVSFKHLDKDEKVYWSVL